MLHPKHYTITMYTLVIIILVRYWKFSISVFMFHLRTHFVLHLQRAPQL